MAEITAKVFDTFSGQMEINQMLKRLFLLLSIFVLTTTAMFAQGSSATPAATPAATSEAKPKKPVFRSTKDQVKEAQTMLKSSKVFSGEVTGVSSAEWKTAVKTYQGDNGLAKTGSLNRATLEKMGIKLTDKQKEIPVNPDHIASGDSKSTKTESKTDTTTEAKTTDGPKRPAPFRANTEQIGAAQKILRDGKMLTGGEDGKLDDLTREGLGKYQETNKIKVTKTLNAGTLEKMGIALTDKQKEQVAAQAAYDAAKTPKN